MNKTELIYKASRRASLTEKDTKAAFDAFIEIMTEGLCKGEKITIPGTGTFAISERAEREGRNPQTGEKLKIKASRSVRFTAGKTLKDTLNSK